MAILQRVFLLALASCLSFQVMSSTAMAHNKDIKITMITWRGLTEAEEGFRAGMLGFDRHISYTYFDVGQSMEKLDDLLSRVNKYNTDLLYVFGTVVAKAAMERIKDVPVVFTITAYPVSSGLLGSEKGSGSNLAGVTHIVPLSDQFHAMGQMVEIKKIGFIHPRNEVYVDVAWEKLKILAKKNDWELLGRFFSDEGELFKATQEMIDANVDIVFLPSSSFLIFKGAPCIQALNSAKIPTLAGSEAYVVKHGAFFGLACSYYNVGVKAAEIAIDILHGAKPGEIPLGHVESEPVVDLRTANLLGIKVPEKFLTGKTVR